MKAFLRELRKRKVIQVVVVYLIAGWIIMQVADVMFPALGLPDWSIRLAAAMLILGFPVAIILSWAYELGPGGLRRESDADDPGESTSAELPAPAPADDEKGKAVAVLPFVDMSADKDQEYFSDGLTEELLNALAQLEDLRVSSRTSSFAFKNSTADIRAVADKLDVQFVVEGSVRKAENRLRIAAQLIEAASDKHIWSQVYDRNLDDVFAIQDDIARQIAAALQVKLLPQVMPARGTANVEAYEHFLRGRSLFNRLGRQNILKSIDMFERATRLDPEFSHAWAALALSHAYTVMFFGGGDEEMAAADSASRKAIALDPNCADGHTARIMVAAARSADDEADAAFRKAIELDPANFEAYYQYGRYQFKRGDRQQALAMFDRARAIDPYDFQAPILSLGILRNQDEQKAREAARDGIRAAEAHLEQHPDNPRAYMLAAGALQYLGDMDRAYQFVESALRIDPESEDTQYNGACFYAAVGETEKALDCLEKGFHDPDWIENDADLESLRDHPRYKQLVSESRARKSKQL